MLYGASTLAQWATPSRHSTVLAVVSRCAYLLSQEDLYFYSCPPIALSSFITTDGSTRESGQDDSPPIEESWRARHSVPRPLHGWIRATEPASRDGLRSDAFSMASRQAPLATMRRRGRQPGRAQLHHRPGTRENGVDREVSQTSIVDDPRRAQRVTNAFSDIERTSHARHVERIHVVSPGDGVRVHRVERQTKSSERHSGVRSDRGDSPG